MVGASRICILHELEEASVTDFNDWITTKQAADLSRFHPEHVRRLLRAGDLQGKRFGTVWMVSRKSLLAYLADEEKRKPGPPKKAE